MNIGYRLLYRLGITPWDRPLIPAELTALVLGAGAPPPGRALDLGCGTGRHSVYLAGLGWDVTAVDDVPRAIAAARVRAKDANVRVRFEEGDVTRLEELGLDRGFTLFLDAGCFHGIPLQDRAACARGVTALRGPDALLLLLAFAPAWRGPAPWGASAVEIATTFGPAWRLSSSTPATGMRLPGPLRNARPTWHLLRAVAGS
jgi:SAM-dependent methyltransferase